MNPFSLKELLAYFAEIAHKNQGIQDFIFGSAERIIERSRSQNDYPLLGLELPDMQVVQNQATFLMDFQGAFWVLAQAEQGNAEAENQAWLNCYEIVLQVFSYLLKHSYPPVNRSPFSLFNNSKIEPVDAFTADNLYGFRIAFRLEASLNLKFDNTKWTE